MTQQPDSKSVLVQRRGRVKGTITRIKTFADSITADTSIDDISSRLERLNENWSEFCNIEDVLLTFDDQTSEMEEYETKFFEARSALLGALRSRTPNVGQPSRQPEEINLTLSHLLTQQQSFLDRSNNESTTNTRLPRLNIPSFSGEYKEWPSFQDLFEAAVHSNSSLSSCQKFQYLKGLLKGNAANIIRHLTISDSNYEEAWKKLKERFDKKGHIMTSLVKAFPEQPHLNQLSIKPLRSMCDLCDEVIRGLKALGPSAEARDPWLIYIVVNKLDADTREAWSKEITNKVFPKFDELIEFLNKRCDALETCAVMSKRAATSMKSLHTVSYSSSNQISCPKCSDNHFLYHCDEFKAQSPANRKALVITQSLCFKCLGSTHSVKACHSKIHCRYCKGNHHSLLHGASTQNKTASHTLQSNGSNADKATSLNTQMISTNSEDHINRNPSQFQQSTSSINPLPSTTTINTPLSTSSINTNKVTTEASCSVASELSSLNSCATTSDPVVTNLLPTAVVHVLDNYGNVQKCRVLLDSGSQVSLISESCAQRLSLKRENARVSISGLASSGVGVTKGKILLTISSRWEKSLKIQVAAFVMNKLTSLIPSESFVIPTWSHIEELKLADPCFNTPSSVDIILGSDHFFEVLKPGKKIDELGRAFAQETIFGWVLFGNFPTTHPTLTNHHISISTDIDKSLARFWELEHPFSKEVQLSDEDNECELHFQSNYKRERTGRYNVSLPFRKQIGALGESKQNAIMRQYAIERRFLKDPNLKEQYVKFMREYEELGHMEKVPYEELNVEASKSFYLPHHAVFKREPVPKIRVVFGGSCKSSSGVSLNDKLTVGPTIQPDLVTTLINFRRYEIAFCSDVEKMYRQVVVSEADRNFQRIVWRENQSLPVQHYRLTTVTYGTACAPFLATRVLQQICEDNKSKFPEAASVINTMFYVDDLLSGASSLAQAITLKDQLTDILSSSGFNLTKWRSNSRDFLKHNNSNVVVQNVVSIDDGSEVSKILGIQWDPQTDTFSFKIAPINSTEHTKRTILSESSRIFDPMGWLAPMVISVKILYQQLWLTKHDWDDPLPDNIMMKWKDIKQQLPVLEAVKIPRYIYSNSERIQLHGFADASELAYAAVIYCRSFDRNGRPVTRIIASKTKVAPLKQISLPRFELCGALLLATLMAKVMKSLSLTDVRVHAWTDSTVVLSWLSDIPRCWKTFVANRTSEILDMIPRKQWRHVPSTENPADAASRGLSPNELLHFDMWWNGPKWLISEPNEWPSHPGIEFKSEVIREEKRSIILSHYQEAQQESSLSKLFLHFSSISKIIRITGYCHRFVYNCKNQGSSRKQNLLSAKELSYAQTSCLRAVQGFAFEPEIKQLKEEKPVKSNSKLARLHPFLVTDGLIRVGGRNQNSAHNFNARHAIILPKGHPITSSLILELHQIYLHPGSTLLIGLIRQRFWIIGIRDEVKKVTGKCITCFKFRTAKTTQLMGNLPEARVTISRPFSRVGIDYAGPFNLCSRVARGAKTFKGYIALFVCFATRALHLEVVSSLTAEAFTASLRRFISRRGIPLEIFCDNGTNFVGARKHVQELQKLAISNANNPLVLTFLSQHRVTWRFNPPGTPHFSGIWEAGVKSVKWHLRRVIGETVLSLEEMTTLLCQIEAILNSRPYEVLSSDPNDLEALTPSHFLIGKPLTTLPEVDITDVKISRLGRWQHVQQLMQSFWKWWKNEYVTSLQERPKWRNAQDNLKEGELVLIREDNLPPAKWLIGRVIACHPGKDNLVRVVSIRTKRGTFDRAINKIFKLPIN